MHSINRWLGGQPNWFWGFLLLLFLLPLPFGSNRPWASDLMGVATALLLLWQMLRSHRSIDLSGRAPRRRLFVAAALFTLVILWCFVQASSLTPNSWHHPLWAEAGRLLGHVGGAISVHPAALTESLVRLLSYAGIFLIALHAGRDRMRAAYTLYALAFAGVFYALYGLLAHAVFGDTILWYKKWAYVGFLTSTFVNKNSYAVYAGLGLLCSLFAARERMKGLAPLDKALAQRSRLAAKLASLSVRDYVVLCAPLLILAALALTGSRAGVAASFFGLFVLLFGLALSQRWKARQWLALFGCALIVFIAFVGLGGDALMTRLEGQRLDDDTSMRLSSYSITKQAIADNPYLGFGLGTFDNAFRLYRDESLPTWFHHAHNDYLEMMMDLGVPMALCLFAALALLVSCVAQGVWIRKKDAIFPSVAMAATAIVGTHVLVDFSMQIPAIAASWAALLGVGVAQSYSTRSGAHPSEKAVRRKHIEKKEIVVLDLLPAELPPILTVSENTKSVELVIEEDVSLPTPKVMSAPEPKPAFVPEQEILVVVEQKVEQAPAGEDILPVDDVVERVELQKEEPKKEAKVSSSKGNENKLVPRAPSPMARGRKRKKK